MSEASVNKASQSRQLSTYVANNLRSLAYSFQNVGNDKLAQTLCDLADDSIEAGELAWQAHCEMLNDAYQGTMNATAGLFHAALAGRLGNGNAEGDNDV